VRLRRRFQTTHGIGALLDVTVILLQSIVEVAVGPMEHVITRGLAGGTRVGMKWGNARFPVPDCLMGELIAQLQEHLGQIARTQLVPEPPEEDHEDDISGVFEIVERSSCTLVEGSLARLSQRNVR